MSWGDWSILGLLAIGVVVALRSVVRHKGGCAGCSGCPHSQSCSKADKS